MPKIIYEEIKPKRISINEALVRAGLDDITELAFESVVPSVCDEGCEVEPDGHCPHGYPSVLLVAGLI